MFIGNPAFPPRRRLRVSGFPHTDRTLEETALASWSLPQILYDNSDHSTPDRPVHHGWLVYRHSTPKTDLSEFRRFISSRQILLPLDFGPHSMK